LGAPSEDEQDLVAKAIADHRQIEQLENRGRAGTEGHGSNAMPKP